MGSVGEGTPYLGYGAADLAASPYARFFCAQMAGLSDPVKEALLVGPVAHELMWPVERASDHEGEVLESFVTKVRHRAPGTESWPKP